MSKCKNCGHGISKTMAKRFGDNYVHTAERLVWDTDEWICGDIDDCDCTNSQPEIK